MKRYTHRLLSLALAVLLAVSGFAALPLSAVAAEEVTVSLSKTRLELYVGETDSLEVVGLPDGVELTWVSADTAVVAVNPDGSLKARKVGETTVTASNADKGIELTCTVIVVEKEYSFDDNIMLTIFWPPSPDYTNDEQFRLMAEAGITVVMGAGNGCDSAETQYKMIELAEKYGMRMIVSDGTQWGMSSGNEDTIMSYAEKYRNLPSVSGFYLRDEPLNPNEYFTVYKALKKLDSTSYMHLNFFPYFVYSSVETYQKQLNDWAALCNSTEGGLDYLMFDLYPFPDSAGTMNRDGFYTNLRAVMEMGLQNNVKTGIYLQSVRIPGAYRTPTDTEIRFEVYTALAFGYKQLSYFTWFTPTGQGETFENGIISPEGVPNAHYEAVKTVNHEVLALGETLVKCDVAEVYFSRNSYGGVEPLPEEGYFYKAENAKNYTFSRLVHRETGRNYIMLVNNIMNGDSVSDIEFSLEGITETIHTVSKTDGSLVPLEPVNGVYTISLTAGDGCLIALPEDYINPADMAATNESIEGKNLAQGAAMTATSSKGTGGWYVGNLTDGNKDAQTGDSVGWQSYEDSYPVLTFDLGEPIALTTVDLYPAGVPTDSDYGKFMPVDTTVSVSVDGETWTEAATVTGYAYDGDPLKIDLNGAVGRYVKLQVKKANSDVTQTPLTQLGEIDIYGSPAADMTALNHAVTSYRALSGDTSTELFLTVAAAMNDTASRQGYVDYLTAQLSREVARLEELAAETTEPETTADTEPGDSDTTDAGNGATGTAEPTDTDSAEPQITVSDPEPTSGGCASSASLGALTALTAAAGAAVLAKKKKED